MPYIVRLVRTQTVSFVAVNINIIQSFYGSIVWFVGLYELENKMPLKNILLCDNYYYPLKLSC